MTIVEKPPPSPARFFIRIYLLIATVGAVIAAPMMLFLGWIMWEVTKDEPTDWLGWGLYTAFGVLIVGGPFVGRALFKRDRPFFALAVSALSFLIAPLLVAALVFGE